MRKNRFIALIIVLAILVPSIAQGAGIGMDGDRIIGKNRYETCVIASQYAHPRDGTVETVVLARGKDFADGLVGTVLAAKLEGALLLARKSSIDKVVEDEIKRLGARKVIILGGESVIDEEVVNLLEAKGLEVERIAGKNRYETAVKVAKEINKNSSSLQDTSTGKRIFLVNGLDYQDAMTAGAVAGRDGIPILFTRANALPPELIEMLEEMGVREVIILGGLDAVGEEVENQLRELGIEVERIAGDNPLERALEIAEKYFPDPDIILIASPNSFPDRMIGGYLGALLNGPLLLTERDLEDDDIKDYISRGRVRIELVFLGGTNLISEDVAGGYRNSVRRPAPSRPKPVPIAY